MSQVTAGGSDRCQWIWEALRCGCGHPALERLFPPLQTAFEAIEQLIILRSKSDCDICSATLCRNSQAVVLNDGTTVQPTTQRSNSDFIPPNVIFMHSIYFP